MELVLFDEETRSMLRGLLLESELQSKLKMFELGLIDLPTITKECQNIHSNLNYVYTFDEEDDENE